MTSILLPNGLTRRAANCLTKAGIPIEKKAIIEALHNRTLRPYSKLHYGKSTYREVCAWLGIDETTLLPIGCMLPPMKHYCRLVKLTPRAAVFEASLLCEGGWGGAESKTHPEGGGFLLPPTPRFWKPFHGWASTLGKRSSWKPTAWGRVDPLVGGRYVTKD